MQTNEKLHIFLYALCVASNLVVVAVLARDIATQPTIETLIIGVAAVLIAFIVAGIADAETT